MPEKGGMVESQQEEPIQLQNLGLCLFRHLRGNVKTSKEDTLEQDHRVGYGGCLQSRKEQNGSE